MSKIISSCSETLILKPSNFVTFNFYLMGTFSLHFWRIDQPGGGGVATAVF